MNLANVLSGGGLGGAMSKLMLLSKYGSLRSSEITSGIIQEVASTFGKTIDQVTCDRVASVLTFDDGHSLAEFIQAPGNFEKVLTAIGTPPDSVQNDSDDDLVTCSACNENFVKLSSTKCCPFCAYTPK